MNVLVILKMVPDVVEELEVAENGAALDVEAARMMLSESDDHALEEALLLKERLGGKVTVVALDAPDVDEALYTALAKGADRVVKIEGLDQPLTTSLAAAAVCEVLRTQPDLLPADLILTGAQAIDDLDGLMAPLVAHHLRLPYLGVITGVAADEAAKFATVVKEYSGGVRGEFEVPLPAVLGVQSAERPPRYVPVAKIRAVMKTGRIETAAAPVMADGGLALTEVLALNKPEEAGGAEILSGAPEEAAGKLCGVLAERGVL
jgi:electron transfer flavoprotein beta subunit